MVDFIEAEIFSPEKTGKKIRGAIPLGPKFSALFNGAIHFVDFGGPTPKKSRFIEKRPIFDQKNRFFDDFTTFFAHFTSKKRIFSRGFSFFKNFNPNFE